MEKLASHKTFDLEYFFQIAPDLLCITGFDGYFKKINPAVAKTLGYTDDELYAIPIANLIHSDDQELTAQKRAELTKGQSLLNFENRYLAKDGTIVWLSWTSVPVMRDQLIFGIAKNITFRKHVEEYDRISSILGMINEDHKKRFKKVTKLPLPSSSTRPKLDISESRAEGPTLSDQIWLDNFETIVRKRAGKLDLSLNIISDELALSQRQLFRHVDRILGITPNKLVRVIRLQLAWEAIASGKYGTIKEISNIAGYSSRSHFSKLFREVYGIHVSDLI
ncbi:helix-turn-helix domain-containing protein [Pedobacter psychroterrae]|uniref:Helix-turn-helix domain-containing protein n=1 Tax=Pedobacter psychroterrae TaxID=2530453 RepID=A0A4R0NV22_9SPHI|nr:helix-turn-helix domain-containing protein [Pedobacter psychroterrae]TCD03883.1 helix-turn-helix domain-containing protein [Pedobacter psychroterrae]